LVYLVWAANLAAVLMRCATFRANPLAYAAAGVSLDFSGRGPRLAQPDHMQALLAQELALRLSLRGVIDRHTPARYDRRDAACVRPFF
jgi:adenosylmethionine-8-amino-7-oxononanoate aminotransferase